MTSYATDLGARIKEDVIAPVAKGTAQGSEVLAKGSERVADATRRMAERTRGWADEVTGARTRRQVKRITAVIGIGLLATYLLFLLRRNGD
jgi:hypothetical protein